MRQAPLPLSHPVYPYLYHLKCAYQHLHNCAAFTTIISRTFSSFHRLNCLHLTQIPYPHLPATDCQCTLFCLSPFATCKPSHATFAFPRLSSSGSSLWQVWEFPSLLRPQSYDTAWMHHCTGTPCSTSAHLVRILRKLPSCALETRQITSS